MSQLINETLMMMMMMIRKNKFFFYYDSLNFVPYMNNVQKFHGKFLMAVNIFFFVSKAIKIKNYSKLGMIELESKLR